MPFTSLILETIDMRSFSNLWYWIALVVVWSLASHRILGVPYDMILRARREGEGSDAADDLVDLARIGVLRTLRLYAGSGAMLVALASFALTSLLVLGFGYGVEFAQALLFLAGPMLGVMALRLHTARKIRLEEPTLERLCDIMVRHRLIVQIISVGVILFTSLWGMFVNLALPSWY